MRDHTYGINGDNEFILGYEIQDDTISVKLSSGKSWKVPFTLKNQQAIEQDMSVQIYNNRSDILAKQKKKAIYNGIVLATASLMVTVATATGEVNFSDTAHRIWLTAAGISILGATEKLVRTYKDYSDIKKIDFFRTNKSVLNEDLLTNPNILAGVCEETKMIITTHPEIIETTAVGTHQKTDVNHPAININSIDDIPLRDLKSIVSRVKLAGQLSYDYQPASSEQLSLKASTKPALQRKRA